MSPPGWATSGLWRTRCRMRSTFLLPVRHDRHDRHKVWHGLRHGLRHDRHEIRGLPRWVRPPLSEAACERSYVEGPRSSRRWAPLPVGGAAAGARSRRAALPFWRRPRSCTRTWVRAGEFRGVRSFRRRSTVLTVPSRTWLNFARSGRVADGGISITRGSRAADLATRAS